jgi:glucokinase
MLLTGDIGGTKTVLALFNEEEGPKKPLVQEKYPSGNYSSLHALVENFFEKTGERPLYAAFGVAGPVVNGVARITNLPWIIDEQKLGKSFHFKGVKLLNDLEAISNAVPVLEDEDLYAINSATMLQRGAKGVVAPGTGLGEGFLVWNEEKGHYLAYSSEGGHASFAPADAQQGELWSFLLKKYGHVSTERVCSGLGIPNIYNFLKQSNFAPEPAWLSEELDGAADPTPVIIRAAQQPERPCSLCRETLRLFVAILGGEAGNFALKIMATGGVYLGGGIPPRIVPELEKGDFMDFFCSKGRMKDVLEKIPVYVIMNPGCALIGSACYGLKMVRG